MNSITCKNCGLKNFPLDTECKRCGYSFVAYTRRKTTAKPRRFSVWSLLMIAMVLGVVYYFYDGVQRSMQEIEANEAKRVAAQLPRQRVPGRSRTQSDQQRTATYADAVKNSSSLNAHQQRVKDTEKAVQQVSNTSAPR